MRELPNEFQAKLNLSRCGRCRSNLTRSAYRRSVCIEEHFVVEGRLEIGMVHDVKELSAELNVEAFRDFFHVDVLEHREIEVNQTGPYNAGPPIVAEKIHAGARNGG